MLAVLEKSLPHYSPCDFSVDDLNSPDGESKAIGLARSIPPAREDFVPAAPVHLPAIKRLDQPHALAQASNCVTEALNELRNAEKSLERQLNGLRSYIRRNVVSA